MMMLACLWSSPARERRVGVFMGWDGFMDVSSICFVGILLQESPFYSQETIGGQAAQDPVVLLRTHGVRFVQLIGTVHVIFHLCVCLSATRMLSKKIFNPGVSVCSLVSSQAHCFSSPAS